MSFISVFDVLGPNMIGPSSSHTAGAALIAQLAQKMIAPPLVQADFTLYGSFAKTCGGGGTVSTGGLAVRPVESAQHEYASTKCRENYYLICISCVFSNMYALTLNICQKWNALHHMEMRIRMTNGK